jgi:hypothetical protein
MGVPPEIEKELDARFERERQITLELVTATVKDILTEYLQRDVEARGQALEPPFAKLQDLVDQMQALTERMALLDRADSAKMN